MLPIRDCGFHGRPSGCSPWLEPPTALLCRRISLEAFSVRGLGIEVTPTPVYKCIYRISLRDATDVQDISLANSDDLPSGVIPVSKEPFIAVLAQLTDARQTVGTDRVQVSIDDACPPGY